VKLGGCGGIVGMIAISMLYIVCFLGAKLTTAVIVNVYKTVTMHSGEEYCRSAQNRL
jgi:hypothetical protein